MKSYSVIFKKINSFLFALVIILTGATNGLYFNITALAAGDSDSTLLADYEFGNSNYVSYYDANNCTIRDTVSSKIMKSNSWNTADSSFNSGSDLYNQNGFICGDLSSLNQQSTYRIEFKISKENDEAVSAVILALGTSDSAQSITDSGTSDIIHLHQDGRLFVMGSDKGTVDDLALPVSNEKTIYTLKFNENARALSISKDSRIIYTQTLSDAEISAFKNVNFVSVGTQASDGSYGYYTGAINCHYYYLRAYSDTEYIRSVDRITVDPVIYTHGEKTAEGYDYGYMMYGTKISDGSVKGEESTSFTLPQGATIESITAGEDDEIGYSYSGGKYLITGSFDSESYRADGSKQLYVDLCFKYNYNSQTYTETHRFSVKTNPVPTHTMIYAQAYQSVVKTNKAAVSFQTTALGSVGTTESGRAKSDAWTGSISHTYRANSWNLFSPYDSSHAATDSSSGSLQNVFVDKSDSSDTVDKVTGYGVTGDYATTGSSNIDVGAESEEAVYYVDKSADSILGANHNAGESDYSINLQTENIYQTFIQDNGTVHIIQHDFYSSEGSLEVQINPSWSNENGIWKFYNIWDNNQKGTETVTLTGSTDNGNVLGDYWTAAQNYTGKNAKATIILRVKVNVFDKTEPRNTFKNTQAKYNSKYYSAEKWFEYTASRLKMEGLLADYEISSISAEDIENLENAYNSLGIVCDYSALISAIKQSKQVLDKNNIYESTDTLKECYDSALAQAFYEDSINSSLDSIESWEHKIQNQDEVDNITRTLQFAYTETVLNTSNLDIKFSIYVDNELVAAEEYHPKYLEELTLDASTVYPYAYNYQAAKWSMGGITVSDGGYSYTFSPKTSSEISCYLITDLSSAESQCRVTLYDYSNRKEMDFYVSQSDTYGTVISIAQQFTDAILYYSVSGWEIDGLSDYNAADTLSGKEDLTVRPIYSPTVDDYKITVSGGKTVTDNGFVFDAKAYITFDDENTGGDFLCWAVKYDDNTYRVVSYNKDYNFFVSGNMQFLAVTTENYNTYKNKLQLNKTDLDDTEAPPSLEDLQNKKPIPSLRGAAEDSSSINGAVWNASEHKLYVIGQAADGSDYESCGLVLTYNGKTLVTPSVSQTDSGQYMVTYKLGESSVDRNIEIMAYTKNENGSGDVIYSPGADITVPADNPIYTINNDLVSLSYNPATGLYDFYQNNILILSDVSAQYKIGSDGVIYDVSDYDTHTCTKEILNDDAGQGILLKAVSKKEGLPVVEQTFKIYNDKSYVLTDETIRYENGGEISSNYVAPLVVSDSKSFMNGSSPWTTFLYTPMDNDSWSTFQNYSLSGTDNVESHEVSAVYNPENKQGLIVGSVTHDQWKTGVSYEGSGYSGICSLKAYGGAKSIEISSDSSYRGEEQHGAVKGNSVKSPSIFIGNYSNWQNGMMEFTDANTAVTPMRSEGDLGGVPFGWNSWGSIADSLTYDNAIGNINKIKELFQDSWASDLSGQADSTPVVMNLDSWWNEISLDGSNENAIKAFVAQCKANGQIPGLYYTPFTSWASESQMNDPDESWWTHPDWVLKKSDGTMYDPIDGGYPLDVTNPEVIQQTIDKIRQFKEWGIEYVKLDFMGHGYLEGQFCNSDITTGVQAYNYAMSRIIEEANKDYGSQIFINLSIAPIFPYQYANGRRMGCDSWYSTENTQYTLNQLTYGFWERGIYKYPDPDHAVIYGRDGDASEGQAKNVMTLNAAVAGNMMLGDSFVEYDYKQTILGIERTKTYDPTGAVNMANAVMWNSEIIDVAKKNKTFRSVINGTPSYANVYTMEDNGDIYFAVFNFSGTNTYRLDIPTDAYYKCTELWSGETIGDSVWSWIDVQLSGETSKIYKFSRLN